MPEGLSHSPKRPTRGSLIVIQVFCVVRPYLVALKGRLVEIDFFVDFFLFLNFLFLFFLAGKRNRGIETIPLGTATTMISVTQHITSTFSMRLFPHRTK